MLAVGNIGGIGRLGLAARASRGLWTPSQLSASLWLDAADASTITQSAGAVSIWADKSGNGRHATQGVGAAQPTINTSTLNGLPVMDFSIGGKFMELVPFTTSRTVIMISRNGGATSPMLSGSRVDSVFTPTWNANGAGSNYRARSNLSVFTNSETGSVNDYGLIIASQSPTGVSVRSFADESTSALTFDEINCKIDVIGRDYAGGDQFSLGHCVEIITIDSVIDLATVQKVQGCLAHKWGLAANLLADHPFKNLPPLA